MTKTTAFFKLVRWQNLLVIALAQSFLHFMIIAKLVADAGYSLSLQPLQFFMLLLSTVFIAAAGNIYNDLQDVEVDKINRPQKLIIGKYLSVSSAQWMYGILNLVGFALAFLLAYQIQFIQLIFIQLVSFLLLRLYSRQLKKQVLTGNLLIAFLTALSVFVVYLYNVMSMLNNPVVLNGLQKLWPFVFKLTQAYVFFAFLSNLIREITKDIEDREGDARFSLRTFAVVYGKEKARMLIRVLNGVLLLSVFAFALYSYLRNWNYLTIYLVVAVLIPVVYFELNARKANEKQDFNMLSTLSKIIMLAGVLSMQVLSLQF